MDLNDIRILQLLSADSEISHSEIGKICGIESSSAISKRIRKLKETGLIRKSIASLDYEKLGFEFVTVTFIKAKYGESYTKRLAEKIMEINGVISLLEILGEIDFVMIAVNRNQNEYKTTMNYLMSLPEVERSDTRVVINKHMFFEPENIDLSSA